MPTIHETAYPRLKNIFTKEELRDVYTPSQNEMTLADKAASSRSLKAFFLIQLKTFQRLGYFISLSNVPIAIVDHIAEPLQCQIRRRDLLAYDRSRRRRRHMWVILQHLEVKRYGTAARRAVVRTIRKAAEVKEDLADLINVVIEELIRQRFELPGFSTLEEEARRGRAEVNRMIYTRVFDALGETGRQQIDRILTADSESNRTLWQAIKQDPGSPTLTHLKELNLHLKWLSQQNIRKSALLTVPEAKVRQFAAEARSLNAARMQEMEPHKRYALATALIRTQVAGALDDIGQMLIKRMTKIHQKGEAALEEFRRKHQAETDAMMAKFLDVLLAFRKEGSGLDRFDAIQAVIGDQAERLIEQCQAYQAYSGNNYLPFLYRFYKGHRKALFEILDQIRLTSTSEDTSFEKTLAFLCEQRHHRGEWLKVVRFEGIGGTKMVPLVDLSRIPEMWWKLVTGETRRDVPIKYVDRRHFEVCVFTQLMWDLKSGDLCIPGSDQFSDYRDQIISWEEYDRTVAQYGEQVGLPIDPEQFVQQTQKWMEEAAQATDASFPYNQYLRIEDGEPVITRLPRRQESDETKVFKKTVSDRLAPVDILDAIVDTENWINWTRFFGPISGHESKLINPRERHVTTAFCYGCGMGPTQTARCLKGFDRKQVAWINQRHITEEKLDEAITELINAYKQFALPKSWGTGKSASADGTKWDLYEQNLLSEYHIRYGGYGGIGYYHVSDTYIALFSHFIPCGVWEAVYILDGLLKNKSDIQPDTLHGDTQSQNTPVFGLSYLLGINLMPRIRNWKDLILYRPSKQSSYTHISDLFSDVIDWKIIRTHLKDMLRVALSIKAGKISASTILRKRHL